MMNNIRLAKGKERLLKIVKHSHQSRIFYFENNIKLRRCDLHDVYIEIQCTTSGVWKKLKFYDALLKKPYVSASVRLTGKNNPFYGKKHTEESKKKMGGSVCDYRGKNNPFYGKKHTTKTKRKISQKIKKSGTSKAKNNPFYGKTHTQKTREILRKKLTNWAKNNKEHYSRMGLKSIKSQEKGRKTSIEKITEKALKERKIKHKYNFILDQKYQYDFLINENIILEVNGDFWHANPLYYSNEDDSKKNLTERQIFKINRDVEKKKYAEDKGYVVYVIWETDIRNNDLSVIENIIGDQLDE